MADSTTNYRPSARPAVMLAVSTACYFLLLLLMLYELDRQHFTSAKAQIVRDSFPEIFRFPPDMRENAWETLYGSTQSSRAAARIRLDAQFAELVDGPMSIYEMTLRDSAGQVVTERRDLAKLRRMNTLANCLFLRGFNGLSDLSVSRQAGREGEQRISGRLVARYATPPNYPPVTALVAKYRLIAAAIIVTWCALYVLLFRYLLRPMQLVTRHLEESRLGRPRLIPRAGGLLESSYNALANLAIQQQLQEMLMGIVRLESDEERDAAIRRALDTARQSFGIEFMVLCEMAREGAPPAVIDSHASPPETQLAAHALSRLLQQFQSPASTTGKLGEFRAETDGNFAYLVESGNRRVLVTGRLRTGLPDHALRLDCARQAAEALSRGLLFFRAHQIDIYRQRSEANIVLSRNLGHDLTNIIATTKLDLMAVRQLLDSRGGGNGSSDELLRQAVDGVLKSTRFLQEIVNLYRSFSYVKRPQYERQNLTDVVGQFLDAFEPTVSSRITIRRELPAGLPTLILEPRLLKLALFNLVSNAIDAIRRSGGGTGAAATISVQAAWLPADETYRIVVQDNGPGIRDKAGRLLDPAETDMIFEYGYSTKTEQSEGLGLNWVRTIIVDFHAGSVHAENLPGGGAAFHLVLRSMESSEAKIGQQQGRNP